MFQVDSLTRRTTVHGAMNGVASRSRHAFGSFATSVFAVLITLANAATCHGQVTTAQSSTREHPKTTQVVDIQSKPHRILPRTQPQSPSRDVVKPTRAARFAADFAFNDDDVVVFMGGTNVARQAEFGYLETLLTLGAGESKVYFRNMGWPADTVYRQQRPRNFGTHGEQLDRVQATIVIATFGQMEVLDGLARLPDFIAAYESLLDELAARTQKIVLVTPLPFAHPAREHLPDLTAHNPDVAAYSAAIVELARRRDYVSVDLGKFPTTGLTTDSLQLTANGAWQVAFETSRQLLQRSPLSAGDIDRNGKLTSPKAEKLRQAILGKNVLWKQHWRPTNWSFAYGNRTHVPSSHDHRPGQPRWFPNELDGLIPLIEQSEDQLLKLR